jgi:hypothetical protein
MQRHEADINEPIYYYLAIIHGDSYMFDYPFNVLKVSNTLIPAIKRSSEVRHSVRLFRLFAWRAHDHSSNNQTSIKPL